LPGYAARQFFRQTERTVGCCTPSSPPSVATKAAPALHETRHIFTALFALAWLACGDRSARRCQAALEMLIDEFVGVVCLIAHDPASV